MTDAQFTREEAERLLEVCEELEYRLKDRVSQELKEQAFIAAARTALPRALREVLRLQEQLENEFKRLRAEGYRFAEGDDSAHTAVILIQDLAVSCRQRGDKLADWRKLQPDLDRLSELLDVCEGVSPLGAAVAEIERLRMKASEQAVKLTLQDRALTARKVRHKRNLEEIARLRRALDEAGVVLEDER